MGKNEKQKAYVSSAGNPDSFDTGMDELEYLDMFINCDLWHLVEIESKW